MARVIHRFRENSAALAILMISLTAVLVHGLAIPALGYYYDDWSMLWSGASRGASSLVTLFSTDRPFMGVIYTGFYFLIRDNIAGWHLFSLLFRVLEACAFYWILTLVWPKQNKSLFVLAGMLFVVFPGFLAEPNAATKINHLLGYAAALFSIAFTLKAALAGQARQRVIWTGLALVTLALYLWIYEYMIGLEVMRLTLLFLVLWPGKRAAVVDTIKRIVRIYIPYVAVLFLFLMWRVFVFDSTRGSTNMGGLARSYLAEPVNMVFRLIFQVIRDFFSAWLFAWFEEAYQYLSKAAFAQLAAALLLAAVAVLLAVGFLYFIRKQETTDEEQTSPAPWLLVITGAVITLGAVFPVVFSDRLLDLTNVYKSYALHPSAGAMILLLGLVLMLKPRYRASLLVAMLALAVTTQSLNIQRWANFWQVQRNFWWQVSWRAPDIETNTLVMAYTPDDYLLQQDYEMWGPLNLIYRPSRQPWPLIQAEVLNPDTLVELFKQSFLEPHVRDIYVPKYYSHYLLFSQPSGTSCVQAIDGTMPVYSARERGIVEQAGRYSRLSWINPTARDPVVPQAIFGKEPPHGWCYYYQKAELARQTGDWKRISAIYDSVKSVGLKAGDPIENLVFIEGLVNSGRTDEAAALVQSAIELKSAAHFAMCNSLAAAPHYPDSFGYRGHDIYLLVCENIDK